MEIKAHAKFLRLSPRKARMALENIRGKRALEAVALLKLTPQKSSREIVKILNSAIANAQNNFGISKSNLVIKSIKADIGPTFKRYKPRARGSADVIKRKMTHLSVILEEIPGTKKKWLKPKKAEAPAVKVTEKAKEEKTIQRAEIKEKNKEKVTEKKTEAPLEAKTTAKERKVEPKRTKPLETKSAKKESEITPKKKITHLKKEDKKPKEKFDPRKEGLFGGIKKFFRRKEF